MAQSHFSRTSIFMGAAIAAVLSNLGMAIVRSTRALADMVLHGFKLCTGLFTAPTPHLDAQGTAFGAVQMGAAKQYADRRNQREPLRIEGDWRLIPSV